MTRLIAVNDVLSVDFFGEFTTKRGLMRIANDAVRQEYGRRGFPIPSALSYDLFRGYDYNTGHSYSPVTFDGNRVCFDDMDDPLSYDTWSKDMTEVDVALFLAAHGPGMYKLARSFDQSADRYRSVSYRLNFWDGEDPAKRAHELMGCCEEKPYITCMQFISDRFGWCNGYNRVTPKCDLVEKNGKTYCRFWWETYNFTCAVCGEEHPITGNDCWVPVTRYDPDKGDLVRSKVCPSCYESAPHVHEETLGHDILTDGLPDGYLSDFHGHTVLTSKLGQCAICDACGKVTVNAKRLGLKTYCEDCYTHEYHDCFRNYGHTTPSEGDFRSVGDADRDMGLFLGIELETVAPAKQMYHGEDQCQHEWGAIARDIAEMSGNPRGFVVPKYDSSLDLRGVELATMPATPLYHLTNGFWPDLLSYGSDDGVRTPSCCGLHIHFNTDYLGDLGDCNRGESHLTVNRFVNRFGKEWRRFSGRGSLGADFNFCKLEDDSEMGIYPEDCARRKRRETEKKLYGSRYRAVNNNNDHTIEFRFFAGTMDLTDFRGAIECAAGLAIMAKTLNLSGDLMETWEWDDVKSELCAALKCHGLPCEDFLARCKSKGC